jgi:hypothetical protein
VDGITLKRTFLSKLHRNGLYCTTGALLLLVGIPLYQFLVLIPSGYSSALATQSLALRWISTHIPLFVGYRALLIAGFALIISLPFTLFRIIVAQEILGREGDEQEEKDEKDDEAQEEQQEEKDQSVKDQADGMPEFAWRGKGYAVLGAWAGLFGLLLFAAGTLASTLYLIISAASFPPLATNLDNAAPLAGFFALITFTAGGGLLALSCLFFGAVIARSGLHLWPGIWVAFGYMALALAALFGASAAEVSFAPEAGQALLTTPAILLFAIWVLWFGIMLVRLKPE